MAMKKTLILLLLATGGLAACSTSGVSGSNKALAQEITNHIESRDLSIDVNRAIPAQGRSIALTGGFYLRIEGDTVHSQLPYYGEVYSAPIGGIDDGLTFSKPLFAYRVVEDKSGRSTIIFNVRTAEDLYTYTIEVWHDTGRSSITVLPRNRQAIDFMGTVAVDTEDNTE